LVQLQASAAAQEDVQEAELVVAAPDDEQVTEYDEAGFDVLLQEAEPGQFVATAFSC
jgi:hypothetical protein